MPVPYIILLNHIKCIKTNGYKFIAYKDDGKIKVQPETLDFNIPTSLQTIVLVGGRWFIISGQG